MYLLSFISILGWTFFLSVRYKKYACFFPFFVATAAIVILYLGGLAGFLLPTSKLLFYSGLFLPLYAVLKLRFKKQDLKELPTGFYFLLISGVLWFFFTRSATLFGWDEFVWGQFTKVIFNTNAIYTINSAIFENKMNYPPGISLFQYFFLPFNRYSEGALYFSQGIIVLSAISLIFDLFERNKKRFIIFLIALASAFVYFGPGLLSMMNDHITGAIFGSAILSSLYILRSDRSKLLLIPVIFALPLIKTTGLVLSIVIVLVASIDLLISNLKLKKRRHTKPGAVKTAIILILILGSFAFLSTKSWDFYLKGQGTEATSIPALSQVIKSFTGGATEKEKIIIRNFNKAVIHYPINNQDGEIKSDQPLYKIYLNALETINRPGLSTLGWLLVFAIPFGFIVYFQKPSYRTLSFGLYFSLLVGLFIYLLLHLLAYMYFFSEYEGMKLASFSRYISSYFLGVALVAIGSIAVFMRDYPDKAKLLGRVSSIILLLLLFFHTPPFLRLIVPPKMMARSTEVVRQETRQFSNYINANTEKGEKVWLIYQNTNGWEAIMIRYDIVPRKMNGGGGGWSLGEKYDAKDVWTNEITAPEWSLKLIEGKYDYVFLAKADDVFWRYYSELFDNPTEAKKYKLFKVQYMGGNNVRLVAK